MSAPYPPGYIPEQVHYQPSPSPMSVPITTQPGAVAPPPPGSVWVPLPAQIDGVPPGLENLTLVDTIVIQQIYEILELLSGWEMCNRYSLKNANGQQVYFAVEDSECCERQFCGPQRGFEITIVDNYRREVMRIIREFNCMGGCFCCKPMECWAQECVIESPPGYVIGSVKQRPSGCVLKLAIKDAYGNEIFHIYGECCTMPCVDREFPICALDGQEVGMITKKWRGFVSEAFTDADVFCVNFPMDLDVRIKAVLLGATFLIDFMMFEHQQQK